MSAATKAAERTGKRSLQLPPLRKALNLRHPLPKYPLNVVGAEAVGVEQLPEAVEPVLALLSSLHSGAKLAKSFHLLSSDCHLT